MTITFDLLDRFKENKVLQTAQIMSNIPKSSKNASFVTMKTITFKLEVQKNTCLALIIQIMKLKQICFKKEQSWVNIIYFLQ